MTPVPHHDAEPGDSANRVIDALLRSYGESQNGVLERRVEVSLARLEADAHRTVLRPGWLPLGATLLAASLLIAATAFLLSTTRVDATETVRWLRTVALESIDRRYYLHIEFRQRRRLGQTSMEGEYYVRGAEATLQRFETDNGRRVTVGRLPDQVWFMGEFSPVIVRDSREDLRWEQLGEDQPPILSLERLLSQIEDGYGLSDQPSARSGIRTITAKRESADEATTLPHWVQVEYDENSGAIQRVESRWDAPGPKQVRLKLIETLTLPNDWYEHENHHEPSREVIDWSKKATKE